MMRNWIVLPIMILWTTLAFAADDHTSTLQFVDPWVREAPPNVKVLGAFMTIENPTEHPRTLVAAECADFESVELHATIMEGELAKMVQQESLLIPAQGRLELKPGGYHLMLINAKHPLQAGDHVTLTLRFANAEQHTITATVRKMAGQMMHHSHEMMKPAS